MCQILFLNKAEGLSRNFIKKEALVQVFSCEFWKISKNIFFTEHFWAIPKHASGNTDATNTVNHKTVNVQIIL